MIARTFVDTNILLYSIEEPEEEKSKIAQRILDREDLAVSVQVLQEFYTQATRPKGAHPLSHEEAAELIEEWCRFPVQEITLDLMRSALGTKQRYGISYWDATVIEAARELGCDTVLTEDLSDGQDYGGVRVVNPFTSLPA